ncbi:MAG TPA: hypothetical protein VIM12_00850 [Noviherbaspirillum sp.]|uniref:hypothetical protein n=1 Tax=Noviherbaspirillum sp. TaxID=1926288 RepID=UPI002F943B19
MVDSLSEEASDEDRRRYREILRRLVQAAQEEQLRSIQDDFETVFRVMAPQQSGPPSLH